MHADYNNDGRPDVLVLRGGWLREAGLHPDSLLRNNGDGTFEDVTEAAGLLTFIRRTRRPGATSTTTAGSISSSATKTGDRTHIRSSCSTTTATAPSPTWRRGFGFGVLGVVKGVAWGDYDNDGRPDLYVSRFGKTNLLFRNERGSGSST